MIVFDDLKSQWAKQPKPEVPEDGVKMILEKMTSIKRKQGITNAILAITIFILIAFFVYISAHKFQIVMIGLLLMIGVLIVRIILEIGSLKALKKMNLTLDVETFKQRMVRYYNNRKNVHFIFTPLIILLYCTGFVMLLPSFKASLSEGFYSYILVSAAVVLVVLVVFIFKQIQKELAVLKELKG